MDDFKVEMKKVSLAGTYMVGVFPPETKYFELLRVFGRPNGEPDGYDTYIEWQGEIGNRRFSIYNYKTRGIPIEEIADWHIGGHSKEVADDVLEYFRRHKNETISRILNQYNTYIKGRRE